MASSHHGRFVNLSCDRTHFELHGRPFYFCGANCYYLMTRAADPNLLHEVTYVLDAAAAAGLTVLRTWAFNDGAAQWNALQPAPGQFCERVFQALDWVVAEAGRRGLKLLLNLTNYQPDYGGMLQYVRWSRQERGLPQEGAAAEEFYTDARCQRMFRHFVSTLLCRVNTLTGFEYREDPTVLGWGLANEPQCRGDPPGAHTIARWAAEVAAFVKGLDCRHLVTLDCEGFLGPSTPDAARWNPYDCAFKGCDFEADSGSHHIDFACCHLYPDLWLPHATEQAKLDFARGWVDVHVRLAGRLRKPLVLSEFGKKQGGGSGSRSAYYSRVLGQVLRLMERQHHMAGSIFWMTAAPSYPDYDGFTVYLPPAGRPALPSTALPAAPGHAQQAEHAQPSPGHLQQEEQDSGARRGHAVQGLGTTMRRLLSRGAGAAAGLAHAAKAALQQFAAPQQGAPQCPQQGAALQQGVPQQQQVLAPLQAPSQSPSSAGSGSSPAAAAGMSSAQVILDHAAAVAQLNCRPSAAPPAVPLV